MRLHHKLHTLVEACRAPIRLLHELMALHVTVRRLSEVQGRLAEIALRAALPADHLARHGYTVYSQNDEDGILGEIFHRIGATNRQFVEIGTGDGLQCNTTHLLLQGWTGVWLEIDAAACARAAETFGRSIAAGSLRCVCRRVDADNISSLLKECNCSAEPDLLSLDIDGNDYWVWRAITEVKPRVVAIEYNAGFGPELDWVMAYDPAAVWDGSRKQGASLAALVRLGTTKGYRLVGCNLHGVNAFFVREDCAGVHFAGSSSARAHYQPPLYSSADYRWAAPRGHAPSPAEIRDRSETQ